MTRNPSALAQAVRGWAQHIDPRTCGHQQAKAELNAAADYLDSLGPYTANGYKVLYKGSETARHDYAESAEIYARHLNAAHRENELLRAQKSALASSPIPKTFPREAVAKAEHARIVQEAKRNLALTQGCLECNADDERRWQETIEWLERLA